MIYGDDIITLVVYDGEGQPAGTPISTDKLADGSVTTAKIADGSITPEKLEVGMVVVLSDSQIDALFA